VIFSVVIFSFKIIWSQIEKDISFKFNKHTLTSFIDKMSPIMSVKRRISTVKETKSEQNRVTLSEASAGNNSQISTNIDQLVNVDQLVSHAMSAMDKKQFSYAVKNFCLSIEKLLQNGNTQRSISQMNGNEKLRLAKLYSKRAECNLELAKIYRSERNVDMVIEDCVYLLETEHFNADVAIRSKMMELNRKVKQFEKRASQLKMEITARKSSQSLNSTKTTTNPETQSQRRRRFQIENDIYIKVSGKLSSEFFNNTHQCPICFTAYRDFIEVKIVAIIPCKHSCCADCLFNFHKSLKIDSTDDETEIYFGCPLCRFKLSELIFDEIAHAFVKRRLISTFNFIAKKLPFSQDYLDNLISSLLAKTHNFDLSKVEYSLFNMIGLVDQNPDKTLNAEKKQQFYVEARAPVKLLHTELLKIRQSLALITDTESQEAIEMKKKLKRNKQQAAKGLEKFRERYFRASQFKGLELYCEQQWH
jgi:hypothetical protein